MKRLLVWIILGVAFINLACGSKEIKEDTLAKIYVDLLFINELNTGDLNKINSEKQKLFQKYNTTEENYKESLENIGADKERWRGFFDRVDKLVEEKRIELGTK
ncbi:MAG TPA: DUF4296 domain-containing protein [Ignavibacteriales bacterium]|nr:DUF4296 domain-containing protein [Ignavibacteriales bacterium]